MPPVPTSENTERWNWWALLFALIPGIGLQFLWLPHCGLGDLTYVPAFFLDAFIVLRVSLGLLLREKGGAWKPWTIGIALSAPIAYAVTWLVLRLDALFPHQEL